MRILKFLLLSCLALFSSVLLALSGTFLYLSPNLPSVETLRSVRMQVPLRIYSDDGKLIAEFGEMRRSPIRFEDIPQDFINALLAAEDDNFAEHYGVDPKSLMRAAAQLIQSGRIQTGGSTITMQVAKNFFLSSERSFARKANEILLALQIERALSKNEILELYVNKIYLGNRAYGIEAAAQVYYGRSISQLSLAEMAMIAGLPKAPSRYNPVVNPERAKIRRDWILSRLHELGRIDRARYEAALAEPVEVRMQLGAQPEMEAPYIAEMVRAELVGRYGSDAYTEGFRVYTTVRSDLQAAANQALRDGLLAYDRRHGWRGPELHVADPATWPARLGEQRSLGGLEPVIVTQIGSEGIRVLTRHDGEAEVPWSSMRWARAHRSSNSLGSAPRRPADVVRIGDLIRVQRAADGGLHLAQLPEAQGALVSLDPHDGAIRALSGGFSFEQSNYNRATQAKRQPGSSFKPFIYSAALDKGFTPASLIDDGPLDIIDPGTGKLWSPRNSDGQFLGMLRLREALYRSRNLVSIRLMQAITPAYAVEYVASTFALPRADLAPNLSLALGTSGLTPLEVTRGYAVFANGGHRIEPYLITRIDDRDGNTLFSASAPRVANGRPASELQSLPTPTAEAPPAERVMDARTAYIMTDILRDAISRGTARRALSLGRNDLAGKTGTTNEQKDAWFAGYNGDFVTTAWVGFDQPQNLGRGEYGGVAALPIWIDYMRVALDGRAQRLPPEPDGLLRLRIDPQTGRAARAGMPRIFELFRADMPPEEEPLFVVPPSSVQDNFSSEPPPPVPIDLF